MTDNPEDIVEAIDAMVDSLPVEVGGDLTPELYRSLEPSAPNESWEKDGEPGLAFPVTDELSLGLDYRLEEIEDLTADRIKMGTASADHASHNVMIRAQWQFDLPQ